MRSQGLILSHRKKKCAHRQSSAPCLYPWMDTLSPPFLLQWDRCSCSCLRTSSSSVVSLFRLLRQFTFLVMSFPSLLTLPFTWAFPYASISIFLKALPLALCSFKLLSSSFPSSFIYPLSLRWVLTMCQSLFRSGVCSLSSQYLELLSLWSSWVSIHTNNSLHLC